ncbi:MAG: hypothetical protein EAZ89_04235 [Bacteroidetes bacterium]|jgi:hypothetical protein|nr:MAG: hypothetical protein EAZ89_04235 [Bacteroidota bacterium]
MNRIAFVIAALLFTGIFSSCNQEKLKQLESQNTELQNNKRVQDSLLNDFVSTFNAFEDNLESIKEKQNLVSMSSNDPEMAKSGKDKIIDDIQLINGLLDQNQQIIDELTKKVQSAEGKSNEMSRMVTRLKKQLADRDAEVNTLKQQLVALNISIDSLNVRVNNLSMANEELTRTTQAQGQQIAQQEGQIQQQAQTIKQKEDEMNTAYYIVASSKELKDLGILDRSGAFKPKTVQSDFDESAFTRIDIRNVKSIPVNAKKPTMSTSHPSGTYEMKTVDKTVESIQITDAARFWKNSKYLVVVLN